MSQHLFDCMDVRQTQKSQCFLESLKNALIYVDVLFPGIISSCHYQFHLALNWLVFFICHPYRRGIGKAARSVKSLGPGADRSGISFDKSITIAIGVLYMSNIFRTRFPRNYFHRQFSSKSSSVVGF